MLPQSRDTAEKRNCCKTLPQWPMGNKKRTVSVELPIDFQTPRPAVILSIYLTLYDDSIPYKTVWRPFVLNVFSLLMATIAH